MRVLSEQETADLPDRVKRPVLKRHRLEGGRGEIYPYDEWADGQWREAERGVDFDVTINSFYSNLKQWAKRNGGVQLQVRQHGQRKVLFRLGPYTEEQEEIRRFYVHPSQIRKSTG